MTCEEFTAVLTAHYQVHRVLEPQDIYKLIYQRVFGPEHSVDNLRAAWGRLYVEILHLDETPTSLPLIEPLSSRLCRVNLQPFVQGGGSAEVLWKMFRQTVDEFQPGSLVDLQRTWSLFLDTPWARDYASERLEQFWLHMATADFPPAHHSHGYAAANAPHYRVVLRGLATECLGV